MPFDWVERNYPPSGSRFVKYMFKYYFGNRPLNIQAEWMRFYVEPFKDVHTPRRDRCYQIRFPHYITGYIMCELSVKVVQWQPTRMYQVTYCLKEPNGNLQKLFGNWNFSSGKGASWYTHGWGRDYWMPGEYQAWYLMDGVEVARNQYVIEPPPPPKPPPTPTEVLQLPSVQFYASGRENIRFPQQTTREVSCVVTVRNVRQQDWGYYVTVQCSTVEGRLLWESKPSWWWVTSQEQESSFTWNIQTSGWRQGIYRVEILIDGKDFAWGAFTIE